MIKGCIYSLMIGLLTAAVFDISKCNNIFACVNDKPLLIKKDESLDDYAKRLGLNKSKSLRFNKECIELVLIPAQCSIMGNDVPIYKHDNELLYLIHKYLLLLSALLGSVRNLSHFG